jgi:hypothetical protein
MRSLVHIREPSGTVVALGHGAVIGRLWSADLQINDARVSEAHAMVSLRGRDVRLLALRGRFVVDGQRLSDVVLSAGLRVVLAKGLELEVVAVQVPEAVLALELPGGVRQVIGGVTSLFGGLHPRVVAGWDGGAADYVWPTGAAWMRGTDVPVELLPGDQWEVDGALFRAVELPVEGAAPTAVDPSYAQPITLTARYDTVHIARAGEPVVVIAGQMARVLTELVAAGVPLGWEPLARQAWSDGDRDLLRHRWDMQVRRLKQKLMAHGLRKDLVRADGSGLIELVLGPDDVVIDES